ncbi:hypothetical protein SKAU_G00240070 [Synaphobranchus kaupii]|uniref:Uncharacterized protein n=1 Tax=Synaphobranchus kaupii TaxID=118154 RepID=A0A9Q1F7E1_SYNKA|nr:hypothetical protein SKAU_G00240070 [Synaphobranchus kaupii]
MLKDYQVEDSKEGQMKGLHFPGPVGGHNAADQKARIKSHSESHKRRRVPVAVSNVQAKRHIDYASQSRSRPPVRVLRTGPQKHSKMARHRAHIN